MPTAKPPIRIALMCENPLVYRSLSSRLAADPAFEVIEATDCQLENVPFVVAQNPQAVLLGISRISHFNLLVCKALHQANPQVNIILLPSYEPEPIDRQNAEESGASAIMLKSIDTPALVDQLRLLVNHH